jgi:hypothetical protein
MSKYLARLKSEKSVPKALQKVQKGVVAVIAVHKVGTFSKKQTAPTLSKSEQQLADEATRRDNFCDIHREMKGGCTHHDITKGFQAGDRIAALYDCLLWQLINSGRKIEQAGAAEITTGITVADVLAWVKIDNDVETIRNERRLLLTCARSMSSTRH